MVQYGTVVLGVVVAIDIWGVVADAACVRFVRPVLPRCAWGPERSGRHGNEADRRQQNVLRIFLELGYLSPELRKRVADLVSRGREGGPVPGGDGYFCRPKSLGDYAVHQWGRLSGRVWRYRRL